MLNADNEKFIENCADLSSNTEFLTRCLNYQRTFQKSFLKHLKSTQTESFFGEYLALLDGNSYFLCGKFCCKNILNIVLDFPESYATLMSLKKCLDHTNLVQCVLNS